MAVSIGLIKSEFDFSDLYNFLNLHPIVIGFSANCMIKEGLVFQIN